MYVIEETFLEPQKDELIKIPSPLHVDDEKISNTSVASSNNSMKLAPLFRMVSIPDEQVPGLNHLVNRPQSWVPQPRSKRPIRGIFIF